MNLVHFFCYSRTNVLDWDDSLCYNKKQGDRVKIEKYTKLKDNRYIVKIDDLDIKLYDDVIVKYELLRLKKIDDKLFKEIVSYNNKLEAYYKSLKYITRKLRTEQEIFKYLEKDYDKSIILDTIDKLKKNGYLNRELYLKSFVSDQIHMNLVGQNRIKKDLVNLGYTEEEIVPYIEEVSDDVWFEKINKLVVRKINANRNLGNNKLKEKISYDLCNLGFYKWMVEEVIHNTEFKDNSDLLEKEYNKLFNKLSKKYDGSVLYYQIKVKLVQKGFNSSEIDDFVQNKKNL